MPNLKQLWRDSLLFRRIIALSVFALATLLVFLGSNIPRSVPLPDNEINAKTVARIGEEELIIQQPDIAQGDVALSYVGNKNEVAEIWLDNATLDDTSARLLFAGAPAPKPGKISYTAGEAQSRNQSSKKSEDTCHTTIEIRRAKDTASLQTIKLYQTDTTAGAQQFRQVVIDAPGATLELEVHTDSPDAATINMASCHRLLNVGGSQINLPPLPVHLLVRDGNIDLRFNPADPGQSIWTGPQRTFEAVSLGGGSLRANGLQVVSIPVEKTPKLDIHTHKANSSITLSQLKLGSDQIKLDVGRDTEVADAYANGKPIVVYDLIGFVQKNPILSFAFAAVLVPALWKWVQKTCFPESPSDQAPK